MKLGLWNRLAIVLTGLALLVGPLAIQMHEKSYTTEIEFNNYSRCYKAASSKMERDLDEGRPVTFQADVDVCGENLERRLKVVDPYTWERWFAYAGAILGIAALIYVLIWLAVITARWVWRGRTANAD